MEEHARRTFRITPWRPWLLALVPVALFAGVGMVTALGTGERNAAAAIVLVTGGLAVVLLVPISLVARVSRWHVDPDGIGGRNNWFVYRWLAWSDITAVEPWPIPGYRYVQVNGVGRRWAFWLPLFMTDMPGLRAVVTRYAPSDNPLRCYLENHVPPNGGDAAAAR